ncbi:Dabb family protein [Streptomyces sp. NPDC052101]|uniref:Dabb family protein n=1 Tax=Streptomyces sp. NPDC052101 TaxID=3155763 RepID=UPI0034441F4C
MTRWVSLLPAEGAEAYPSAVAVPGVSASSAAPDLPGSFGGAGGTWDLTADQPPARVAAALSLPEPLETVALAPVRARTIPLPPGPRVKRTLLLAVRPTAPENLVAHLERDLLAMPEHISTIRSWALSRVDQALTPSRWTHVWEQEYVDVEGLTGEYLGHSYHWTCVDRWFDGEVPGAGIVEPRLAHVFRWADAPMLPDG